MPMIEAQLTLGAAATQLSTAVSKGVAIGSLSCRHIKISPPAHTTYVGSSEVSATKGFPIAASSVNTNLTATEIGPSSGDGPINTNEVYFFGTAADVVQVILVVP